MATRKYARSVSQSCVIPIIHQSAKLILFKPATENLVGYSLSQPTIFKAAQSRPITDLKLLVKDYAVCDRLS